MPRQYPIEKTRDIGIIAHIDAGKTTVTERILFYTGVSHKIGEVHEGTTVMDWMIQERERGVTITAAATTFFWIPEQWRKEIYPVRSKTPKASADRQEHRTSNGVDQKERKNLEYKMNLIDTPGHIDFTAEVQRSLRVLDGVVVVFDGVAGVEAQSETVWHQADKWRIPRLCFINKLDRMGADWEKSLKSIWEKLSPNAVAMQIPIGLEEKFQGVIDLLTMKALRFEGDLGQTVKEVALFDEKGEPRPEGREEIPENLLETAEEWRHKLVEKIAAEDEHLLEKFLDEKEIPVEDLKRVLRKATLEYKIVPVFCGSALKNKGIQLLLDGICYYLPSPIDLPPVKGTDLKTGKEMERKADDKEPFSALAFKVAADPFVGTLIYFRVYSGQLTKGSYVLNSTKEEKERIGRILRMHANSREEISELFAGDIAATVGLKNTSTGHTLCDEKHPILLEKITFPEPVISIRIEPKTKADQEKLGMALKKLGEEDPTFQIRGDQETGETIISGMGEFHLEIINDRLKREFGVEANVGKPQVAYKETILAKAEAEGKYIRQSGGRGQYGHVWLRVRPKERGEGFEFVDEIKGGIIPREFIPAVEKGIKEAMQKGVIAGYPLIDMEVTLYDGSYHEVDSSEIAFKIAGSAALQGATKRAKPILLEPIMRVEVTTPDKYFGDVIGDLNSRRGKIEETSERGTVKVIEVKVPLSEMFGYATALRSLTGGRGTFTMEFDRREKVPDNIAQEIIEGKRK